MRMTCILFQVQENRENHTYGIVFGGVFSESDTVL